MNLGYWNGLAVQLKPIFECIAFVLAGFGIFKWLLERGDRATDVLLKLEEEFRTKCESARLYFENNVQYNSVKAQLSQAAADGRSGDRQAERQLMVDDLLRFYVVLYSVRQERQLSDASLSTCYRYWLAHYYRHDRSELRHYLNEFFPTLKKWLLADTCWWKRLLDRPYSPWWKSFFRPTDFWEEDQINRNAHDLARPPPA